MVAPLRLKGSETSGPDSQNPDINAGVSVYALQEMSESEVLDGISYKLLKEFAKIDLDVPKTGDLTLRDTIGDTPTTSMGDFVDTTRTLDVGDRGSVNQMNQILTNQTSIYQVLTPVTGTVVRPLCYENLALREMTDQEIIDSILTPTMNRMTNRGIGSYHFSSGTPVDPISGEDLPGTWAAVFNLTDRYKTGVIPSTSVVGFVSGANASTQTYAVDQQSTNLTTTYTLWRKLDEDSPPESQPRPLKWANTADRGKHVVEMTNQEILTLLVQFRNLIVTDGRGRYKFQNEAPSGGSWSRRGDAIQDLLNSLTDSYFQTAVTNTSTGFFTQIRYYSSQRTLSYTGSYTRIRTVFFGDNVFDSDSTARYTGSYTGTYSRTITVITSGPVQVPKFYANITINTYNNNVIDSITLVENNDYLWVKRLN